MHHPARALAAVVVAAVAVTLSGCAASTETDPPAEAVEVTTDPTTEPTEPEVPVPANGEVLDTPEKVEAAKAADLEVYEMNDGTKVAIDPAQPLPQPVVAEGIAEVQSQFSPTASKPEEMAAAATQFEHDTGKNVIVIFPVMSSVDGGATWDYYYQMTFAYHRLIEETGTPAPRSPDLLVADAQAYIAQQPNPETWEIVVVPIP